MVKKSSPEPTSPPGPHDRAVPPAISHDPHGLGAHASAGHAAGLPHGDIPLPPPERPWWRRVLFQPRVLLRLAGWLLIGLAAYRFMDLAPDLSQRTEYVIGPEHVQITPLPRWIPGDVVAQVFDGLGAQPQFSVLDPQVNAKLAEAFRGHPWVADVRRVKKSFPTRIELELDYRRPVAMVRVAQGLYPVDLHGVLLPPNDFDPATASTYPLIQGIRTPPRSGPGHEWGEPLVLQAAGLATALAPHWKPLKLEAILCPRTAAEPFVLLSAGTQIFWGHPPSVEDLAEPTTRQKIGRLQKYVNDFGGFDQPRGPYEIDIRHFKSISRRPLMQADVESRKPAREPR